jgi:hypothetical protein
MSRGIRKPTESSMFRNVSVAFAFFLTVVAAAAGFVESRQSLQDYRAAPADFASLYGGR